MNRSGEARDLSLGVPGEGWRLTLTMSSSTDITLFILLVLTSVEVMFTPFSGQLYWGFIS